MYFDFRKMTFYFTYTPSAVKIENLDSHLLSIISLSPKEVFVWSVCQPLSSHQALPVYALKSPTHRYRSGLKRSNRCNLLLVILAA